MNPWLRPIITAIVISAIGAGGLSFLRSQQPAEEPVAIVAAQPAEVAEPPPPVATKPAPVAKPEQPVTEPAKPSVPSAPVEKPSAPPTPAPVATPTVTGPTTIKGVVKFTGTPPRRAIIKTDADPKCAEMHADKPMQTEDVIVNADGSLRNVFVYVKAGLEGQTFTPPKTPVLLEQHGCHYEPHVLGMMARQSLLIRNDDDTLHNVHAQPTKSKEFNVGQPNQGMETTRTIGVPEVMVKFKRDVHPWMSAYIGVVDNPFFAVTGDGGAFALKDLPPGTYTIAAWHETLGTQEQVVKVGAGATQEVVFQFGK